MDLNTQTRIWTFAKLLTLQIGVFTLCRLLFFVFNADQFDAFSIAPLLAGLVFDLSAIAYLFYLFAFFFLFPYHHKIIDGIAKGFYLLGTFIGLFANLNDIEYFKFTGKRSTSEVFTQMTTGDDFTAQIPQFFVDFWHIPVLFIILFWLVIRNYNSITSSLETNKSWLKDSVFFLVTIAVFAVLARGGFGVRPMSITTASRLAPPAYAPVTLNTPYTLIRTWGKPGIELKETFSQEEVNKIFNPRKAIQPAKYNGANKNVVILILESFGAEYCGFTGSKTSYTPFLDSLADHSLNFVNMFANGKKSVDALPALFSGIPKLMEQSYMFSPYASNQVTSLAGDLHERNYASSFFHGGTNGTMAFNDYVKAAHFDRYFGRTEYNNEEHYDGNWGIWDEEFLGYFADQLNEEKQPFLSALFTLSSHHPFVVPDRYTNKFPKGESEIHETVGYADYALQQFFDQAKQSDWFNNTIFVITADHTSLATQSKYKTRMGTFRIPLLFYCPSLPELKGIDSTIAQQADLYPSVLSLLGGQSESFSFGKNLFEDQPGWAAQFYRGYFQLITDSMSSNFDGENDFHAFNYLVDPILRNQLPVKTEHREFLEAIIQQFNQSILTNDMQRAPK